MIPSSNDTIESSRWRLPSLELPNASDYLSAIYNISMADIGSLESWSSNTFYEEACQMLANSIIIYRQGYFDAAFYSLRQAIELSIGTLYLNANPNELGKWVNQEDGFESGKMTKYLREKEPVFKNVREKMSDYFDFVFEQRRKIDKYVHKQGFRTFYTTYRCQSSDGTEEKYRKKVERDFVRMLKASIGAVAVYRLIIDPLPVLLNEEEIITRSPDFLTEPYTETFIKTYIGEDVLNQYRETDIYKSYRADILSREKQNEAVFDVLHYQHFDKSKLDDIYKQIHLLSLNDRIAYILFSASEKIAEVFVDALLIYTSNLDPFDKELLFNYNYFEGVFDSGNDYNNCRNGGYISRLLIDNKYTYIKHNNVFVQEEISILNSIAVELTEKIQEQNQYWKNFMNKVKTEDTQS